MEGFRSDLKKLALIYAKRGSKNQYGISFRNKVGLKINFPNLEGPKTVRSITSHMIQGIETDKLLSAMETNETLCSLEHDGFRSYSTEINSDIYIKK